MAAPAARAEPVAVGLQVASPAPAGKSPKRAPVAAGSPASVSTATGGGSPASAASPAAGLAKERLPAKPRDNAVMLQLTKTKMCAFFERGRCSSNNCRYAHSAEELRSPPNLQKTKLCRAFMQGNCQDENCMFAHGDGDLRVTAGIYKTQMCNFYERGYCKKGDRCNHAHGIADLRPSSRAVTAASAAPRGADGLRLQPGHALPLAELLADPEDASRASAPTPTKSVTELASLAFSPMPQSPLWPPYGMPHALSPPAAALGARGDPLAALWPPRDPVDVLTDMRANKENEVPFVPPFHLSSPPLYTAPELPTPLSQGTAGPREGCGHHLQEPWGGPQVALDLSERLASLDVVVRELSANMADLCGGGEGEGKRLLHKI